MRTVLLFTAHHASAVRKKLVNVVSFNDNFLAN